MWCGVAGQSPGYTSQEAKRHPRLAELPSLTVQRILVLEEVLEDWSLLAVLCKGRGLVTTLVCSSCWPQVWQLHCLYSYLGARHCQDPA